MNMHDLLEGELLSIEWAQEKTYAGLEVLTVDDRRVRIRYAALNRPASAILSAAAIMSAC